MKDRKSLYPGRVRLTPVEGQENVFDLERADEPTVLGTPLDEQHLLPVKVVEALGLIEADDPSPADAFMAIAEGLEPEISLISVNEAEENTQFIFEHADGTRQSIWARFDIESGKLRELEVDGRAINVRWGTSSGSGT